MIKKMWHAKEFHALKRVLFDNLGENTLCGHYSPQLLAPSQKGTTKACVHECVPAR